jgi:hypothetical protein
MPTLSNACCSVDDAPDALASEATARDPVAADAGDAASAASMPTGSVMTASGITARLARANVRQPITGYVAPRSGAFIRS